MWVPLAILLVAVLLQYRGFRKMVGSESVLAFGLALFAVLALFQIDRLG